MRKLMSIILILSLLSTLFGCDKNESATNLAYGFGCCVLDQNGNDLFNPATPGAIDTARIEIYHMINGEAISYFKSMQYSSSMAFISKGYSFRRPNEDITGSNLEMSVSVSWYLDKESKSTTIIKWNDLEADTISILVERTANSDFGKKYWINDDENIDWINKDHYLVKIVKTRE